VAAHWTSRWVSISAAIAPDIGFEPDLLRGVFLELAGPVGHERSSAVINIRSQHAPRVLRR
jgi:hypothetical protein